MRIALVAAVADNGVIGRDGGLPWRLPADLRRFKALTMGKPMIMGRRTFAAIGRPLPGRLNIVVTRDPAFAAPGAVTARSLDGAFALAREALALQSPPGREGEAEVAVIGGAEIYAQALPAADRLHLTEVHEAVAGDTVFPDWDRSGWTEVSREDHPAAGGAPAFSFVVLERRRP